MAHSRRKVPKRYLGTLKLKVVADRHYTSFGVLTKKGKINPWLKLTPFRYRYMTPSYSHIQGTFIGSVRYL